MQSQHICDHVVPFRCMYTVNDKYAHSLFTNQSQLTDTLE